MSVSREDMLADLVKQYKEFVVQECDVYSRVTGYMRPVRQWNKGKQEEWDNRKKYIVTEHINTVTSVSEDPPQ